MTSILMSAFDASYDSVYVSADDCNHCSRDDARTSYGSLFRFFVNWFASSSKGLVYCSTNTRKNCP